MEKTLTLEKLVTSPKLTINAYRDICGLDKDAPLEDLAVALNLAPRERAKLYTDVERLKALVFEPDQFEEDEFNAILNQIDDDLGNIYIHTYKILSNVTDTRIFANKTSAIDPIIAFLNLYHSIDNTELIHKISQVAFEKGHGETQDLGIVQTKMVQLTAPQLTVLILEQVVKNNRSKVYDLFVRLVKGMSAFARLKKSDNKIINDALQTVSSDYRGLLVRIPTYVAYVFHENNLLRGEDLRETFKTAYYLNILHDPLLANVLLDIHDDDYMTKYILPYVYDTHDKLMKQSIPKSPALTVYIRDVVRDNDALDTIWDNISKTFTDEQINDMVMFLSAGIEYHKEKER